MRTQRSPLSPRERGRGEGIRIITTLAALGILFALAACGERPQVLTYKQGSYQGKPDMRAWDNPPFNGDQKAWELALKDRAQTQNEYKRVN